ncbi:MAG: hypothetical protein PVI86_06245 [Phycisphaerae bacterium]
MVTHPSGMFATTQRQSARRADYAGPSRRLRLTRWRQSAMARFGGFDRRYETPQAIGFGALIERRYALMAATAGNAPVYRTMLKPTAGLGVIPARESEGTVAPPAFSTTSGLTIDQRLRKTTALEHERSRSEAWAWFKEGAYRRSARAFEAAGRLEPLDVESRIGELFSHLSLGAVGVAVVLERSLAADNVNPFNLDLDLTSKYADPGDARQLGVESQLWREGGAERGADLIALHALVLWYIGEKDGARATASSAAREFAETDYEDWVTLMDAARGAGGG